MADGPGADAAWPTPTDPLLFYAAVGSTGAQLLIIAYMVTRYNSASSTFSSLPATK